MSNIGFRVKFNDYLESKEKLKEFLDLYFSKFSIMEVKANPYLINHPLFEYLLDLLESKAVSFHISKNFLNSPTEEDEKLLSSLKGIKDIFLITHIPESFSEDSLEKFYSKNNFTLLFENPNFFSTKDYLRTIIEFYRILLNYQNVAGCLDLGHLLYNELLSNKQRYLDIIVSEIELSMIKEFHIHDFTLQKDHQKIGDGLMNLDRVCNLFSLDDTRIILETNVLEDNLSDGEEQVRRILKPKT